MTRLVVVNHFAPTPATSGGALAVAGLAGALAEYWPTRVLWSARRSSPLHTVDLHGRAVEAQAAGRGWLQRHLPRWLRHALATVDTDLGALLWSGNDPALARMLDASVRDGDIVMLCHPWMWPAVARLIERRRVCLVYDAHNVEHQLKRQAWRDGPTARWLLERVRRAEAEAAARAHLLLACTEADAAALAGAAREHVHVGSKGIAPSPRADAMAVAREPSRRALFVGSSHAPNNEAARWIIEMLAPACPEWRFDIAGECGRACGATLRSDNVNILGRVADMQPLLAAAGVALNPIAGGSGINMKNLEALQCGLPLVATPLGARGFETLGPCGVAIAERTAFADVLNRLATNTAEWRALSAAGPVCIRDRFEWRRVAAAIQARIVRRCSENPPL